MNTFLKDVLMDFFLSLIEPLHGKRKCPFAKKKIKELSVKKDTFQDIVKF